MAKSREWDSEAYQRISAPQYSWGQKVLTRLRLRGDERVLDAGCGTGRLTGELLDQLPHGHVVALDLSQNMAAAARDQLTLRFGSRVQSVVADLQHLPFHNVFDCIFSTASFHWVPDHDLLFKSLYGTLKLGATLIAQCGGQGNLARFRERVAKLSQADIFRQFLGDYRDAWIFADPETTESRLKNAGFVDIKTWLEPAPTLFENAAAYCEFVSTAVLHRHLERFPDASLRKQFLDDLAADAAGDDPPFELDYWRLNIDALKR